MQIQAIAGSRIEDKSGTTTKLVSSSVDAVEVSEKIEEKQQLNEQVSSLNYHLHGIYINHSQLGFKLYPTSIQVIFHCFKVPMLFQESIANCNIKLKTTWYLLQSE